MIVRKRILFSLFVLLACLASAQNQDQHSQDQSKDKGKKKVLLPADVLQARTVRVLVDPDAGVSMTDPGGNQAAREDVEKALMKWGRFTPVMEGTLADLVFTVRKGNGKAVNPTIGGLPNNNRPGVLEGNDGTVRIGAQHGRPMGGDLGTVDTRPAPTPQTEVGPTDDTFAVYRSSINSAPVWRYVAKGALRPPNVPAVSEFRKLVEEAEKQQQKSKP